MRRDNLAVESLLKELEDMKSVAYGCFDLTELPISSPFMLLRSKEKGFKGVFFPEDGMVEGDKLRNLLWGKLLEKRGGKPAVALHQGKAVKKLLLSEDGVCSGVQFEDGSTLRSDLVILATGYGTKALVKDLGVDLPLWKLWGASVKAKLKEEATNLFPGPIGTSSYGLFVAITGGKNISAIDSRSFFVP